MVHISEVADAYVRDINDFLKVGDTVKVKVLPGHNGKISLSIKKANPPKKPSSKPMDIDWRSNRSNASSGPASFEDLMSKFMKDSEERLLNVKGARTRIISVADTQNDDWRTFLRERFFLEAFMNRRAVIDVGTHGVKLLVAERIRKGWITLLKDVLITRLGDGRGS